MQGAVEPAENPPSADARWGILKAMVHFGWMVKEQFRPAMSARVLLVRLQIDLTLPIQAQEFKCPVLGIFYAKDELQ